MILIFFIITIRVWFVLGKETETMLILESKESSPNYQEKTCCVFCVLMSLYFWNEAFFLKKILQILRKVKFSAVVFLFNYSFSFCILSKVYRLLNIIYGSLIYCSSHNSLEDLLHN